MAKRRSTARALTVVHDGELTEAEALAALAAAARAATEALPDALAACETGPQRHKVQGDRDTIVLAYLNSLRRSLVNTSTLFEATAVDLEKAAAAVAQDARKLKDATQAINLLTDLVRLAASLSLAFA
jgi:hypothetical protein